MFWKKSMCILESWFLHLKVKTVKQANNVWNTTNKKVWNRYSIYFIALTYCSNKLCMKCFGKAIWVSKNELNELNFFIFCLKSWTLETVCSLLSLVYCMFPVKIIEYIKQFLWTSVPVWKSKRNVLPIHVASWKGNLRGC